MVKFTLSVPRKRSRGVAFGHSRPYINYGKNPGDLEKFLEILKHRGGDDSDDESEDGGGHPGFPRLFGGPEAEVYSHDNDIYFRCPVTKENIDELVKIIDKKNHNVVKRVKTIDMVGGVEVTGFTYRPITLHISSYGGSLLDCMIAVDAIQNSKIPIHTVVEGYAASAATVMSMVGKKRYITKNSYMLIHQLSTWSTGKYEELLDEHKNNTQLMNHLKQLYKDNTKMTKKELDEILKHDIWWNSDECIKRGLVDEIKA